MGASYSLNFKANKFGPLFSVFFWGLPLTLKHQGKPFWSAFLDVKGLIVKNLIPKDVPFWALVVCNVNKARRIKQLKIAEVCSIEISVYIFASFVVSWNFYVFLLPIRLILLILLEKFPNFQYPKKQTLYVTLKHLLIFILNAIFGLWKIACKLIYPGNCLREKYQLEQFLCYKTFGYIVSRSECAAELQCAKNLAIFRFFLFAWSWW